MNNNDRNFDNNEFFSDVNNINIVDTPAESFDNLYGNSSNVINNNVVNNPFENNNSVNNTVQNPFDTNVVETNNNVNNTFENPFDTNLAETNNNVNNTFENPFDTKTLQTNNSVNNIVQNNNTYVDNITIHNDLNNISNNIINNNQNVNTNNLNDVNNESSIIDIDDNRMMSIEEQLSRTSQYNPDELLEQKINIPNDDQFEKNKFSYTFIIVLFIILGVAIMLLPHITKLIK